MKRTTTEPGEAKSDSPPKEPRAARHGHDAAPKPLRVTGPASPDELKALLEAHVAANGPVCPPGSDGCVCMEVIGINGGFAIFTCQDGECIPP